MVQTLGCGPTVGSPRSSSAPPSLGRGRVVPPPPPPFSMVAGSEAEVQNYTVTHRKYVSKKISSPPCLSKFFMVLVPASCDCDNIVISLVYKLLVPALALTSSTKPTIRFVLSKLYTKKKTASGSRVKNDVAAADLVCNPVRLDLHRFQLAPHHSTRLHSFEILM